MRKHSPLAALFLCGVGSVLLACQVPVFRYALENWQPDRLTVAVLHSGEVTAETQKLLKQMEDAAYGADEEVNLRLHPIDVAADHPEGSAEAYYAEQWKDKQLPHLLVYFSNFAPEPQLAWSAPLNEQNVNRLLASPKRKQVVDRLLDGQTAVWVLLTCGDKAADQRAEKVLREELAKKPDEIELPSLTDLATEEKFDETLDVQLRVEFSLITIGADEKEEAFFREMLINTEPDLKDFANEPIVVPVYGRGRTYFALVGAGINPDNIADNCNFICGACSCEVKRDNPGQDLLLAANWNQVEPGNWVNDTPLPALTGIGGFEAMTEIEDTPNQEEVTLDDEIEVPLNVKPAAELASANSTGGGWVDEEAMQEQPSTSGVPGGSSENDLTLFLLGWGGALLCIGVIFTIWRRSRHSE